MYHDLMGYVPNPEAVKLILSQKGNPLFCDAAPHLSNIYQGQDICLAYAEKVVTGDFLISHKQTIGDCVSHGHGRALDTLRCVKEAAGITTGYKEGQTECMTEFIYGAGRKHGRMLGNQDGSVGIFQVESLAKGGFVFRNGQAYDGRRAKEYGRVGPPRELEEKAKENLLLDYALVTTTAEADNALASGSPITICSDQGFSMTRDADGICRAEGSWMHCMYVLAVWIVNGRKYYGIRQSWGPNVPSGPKIMGGTGPDNVFGCDERTMARILSQRDSYAITGLKWQPVPLTWIMG